MYINKYIFSDEELKQPEVEELEPYKTKSSSKNNIIVKSGIRRRYKEKYEKRDNQSSVWDKAILAFEDTIPLALVLNANKVKLRNPESDIRTFINYFTSEDMASKTLVQYDKLMENPLIKSVNINGNHVVITKKDGTKITATKLTSVYSWLSEDQTLPTLDRLGKCHSKSVDILSRLDKDSKIATGQVYTLSTASKYVHSWVETTLNGKQVCVDYTMNAVINKDGYYSIYEPEIITKISKPEFESDMETLGTIAYNSEDLTLKEYLCFHDEVMEIFTESEYDD